MLCATVTLFTSHVTYNNYVMYDYHVPHERSHVPNDTNVMYDTVFNIAGDVLNSTKLTEHTTECPDNDDLLAIYSIDLFYTILTSCNF